MFCPKCGTQNNDGADFCRNCGEPLSVRGASEPPVAEFAGPAAASPGSNYSTPQTIDTAPKKRGGLAIVAVALVVLLVCGAGLFVFRDRIPFLGGGGSSAPAAASSGAADTDATSTEDDVPGQEPSSDDGDAQAQSTTTTAPSSSSSATVLSSTDPNERYTHLVGTWEGSLQTESVRGCKGGIDNPLILTVHSVDRAGRMVADIQVLFHNHKSYSSDIRNDEGDVYLSYTNVNLLVNGDKFEFVGDLKDADDAFGNMFDASDSITIDFSYYNGQITAKVSEYAYGEGWSNTNKQDSYRMVSTDAAV